MKVSTIQLILTYLYGADKNACLHLQGVEGCCNEAVQMTLKFTTLGYSLLGEKYLTQKESQI